jgi:hypothetical protein
MDPVTASDLCSALPEIVEKPEDTPNTIGREQRPSLRGRTLALALAPMVMTPLLALREPFLGAYDMTPLVEERPVEGDSLPLFAFTASPEHTPESEAESANRTRLALLARQYVAGALTTEEEARLSIASERVRRLIPRVTAEDFEALADILEEAHRIESADIERRHRLHKPAIAGGCSLPRTLPILPINRCSNRNSGLNVSTADCLTDSRVRPTLGLIIIAHNPNFLSWPRRMPIFSMPVTAATVGRAPFGQRMHNGKSNSSFLTLASM